MKNRSKIIYGCFIFLLYSCHNNATNSKTEPEASYLKDTFNFEKISRGSTVDISFELKNAGNADLIIKNTSVGCGCTKLKSIKDTISPGDKVDLNLVYDSKDDSGHILKTFVVETNTNPRLHVLYIKGLVE